MSTSTPTPRAYQRQTFTRDEAWERQHQINVYHAKELRRTFELISSKSPDDLLAQLYHHCQNEQSRLALSMIFDVLDRWMTSGRWEAIEQVFQQAALTRIAPNCIIGLLTITLPVRTRIEARAAYFTRARNHLLQQIPIERVNLLLDRLA